MKIQNTLSGGFAEVSEDQAKALIESGYWLAADEAAAKPRPTRARKAPAKTEE